MSLIEVQDILIIYQQFLSQEVLIKDRMAIVFSQISDKKRRKYENIRKMVKLHAKYNVKKLKIVEILLPGSLFKGGCLLDFWKIPPRTLIQDRTCIRNTRVFIQQDLTLYPLGGGGGILTPLEKTLLSKAHFSDLLKEILKNWVN